MLVLVWYGTIALAAVGLGRALALGLIGESVLLGVLLISGLMGASWEARQ